MPGYYRSWNISLSDPEALWMGSQQRGGGGRGPDWTGDAGHAPSLLANIYAWRPGEPTVGSLMTTGGAHCH
jgi:hypothetical protein